MGRMERRFLLVALGTMLGDCASTPSSGATMLTSGDPAPHTEVDRMALSAKTPPVSPPPVVELSTCDDARVCRGACGLDPLDWEDDVAIAEQDARSEGTTIARKCNWTILSMDCTEPPCVACFDTSNSRCEHPNGLTKLYVWLARTERVCMAYRGAAVRSARPHPAAMFR